MRSVVGQRTCPKCHAYFANQLLCPTCGVQLHSPDGPDSDVSSLASKIRRHFPALQAPFLRRLAIGLVLAQGMFWGLRELVGAYYSAIGNDLEWWATARGMVITLGLQLGSLLFAALVAGAGHSRGVLLGVILGATNTLAVMATSYYFGKMPGGTLLFSLPVMHVLTGLIGALVGRRLWRPIQSMPLLQESTPAMEPLPDRPILERDSGPISWARVMAGVVLAFIGTVWAHTIRNYIAGIAGYGTSFQGQFVNWQIATLVVLLASGFAGANSKSGLKHGLIVGALTAVAVIVAQVYLKAAFFPSQEFWLDQLGLAGSGTPPALGMAVSALGTFVVATIGGWLGSQIFQPMSKKRTW